MDERDEDLEKGFTPGCFLHVWPKKQLKLEMTIFICLMHTSLTVQHLSGVKGHRSQLTSRAALQMQMIRERLLFLRADDGYDV